MIIITIFLVLLLTCFFIIIRNMNNDKKPYIFNSVTILLNIFLQIILNYLIGPIIIICLISFICKDGINTRINSVCLTHGKYIIYNILAIINILFYLVIAIFVAVFNKEIGKIDAYTPRIQINTNFELYSGLLKILVFIIYYVNNIYLDDKQIFYIFYHLILLIILFTFSYYIYKNVFFYDKVMNCLIQLGSFLTLWFCLVMTLKDIFELNQVSLFVLIGWIIISILTINLFSYDSSELILNTNIFEINKLKTIEMCISCLLNLIQNQEGTNKTILLGFYYRFREYLMLNPDLKEKFNFLSNAKYLKNYIIINQ